jgi:uncharacterized protein YndB with AHSA1/START domain
MTQDRLERKDRQETHPEADGVLEQAGAGQVVLRFRRRLAHPVERVWAALTDPAELIGWLGQADVDLAEGGKFVLRWLNTGDHGERAEMHATITRLDPPRLLETTGDLHGALRWELQPDGPGTLLTFSSTVDLPAEYRAMVLAGWHWHLDALAGFLGGTPADLVNVTGWDRIHQRYAGPRARTNPFS